MAQLEGAQAPSASGPLLVLFALGAMSVTWMVVVTALVFTERVPRFGQALVIPWPWH
jgi:hypothetical protein